MTITPDPDDRDDRTVGGGSGGGDLSPDEWYPTRETGRDDTSGATPSGTPGTTPPAPRANTPNAGADRPNLPKSDAEYDAEFDAIVAAFGPNRPWSTDRSGGMLYHPGGGPTGAAGPADVQPTRRESAEDRARRRALRRAERAAELAAFERYQAEREAELEADDHHFVPPDPPPMPRPKARTVGALALLTAGVLLVARPGLLSVATEVVLVLALSLMGGGVWLLITGLRRRHDDGSDDGAVV